MAGAGDMGRRGLAWLARAWPEAAVFCVQSLVMGLWGLYRWTHFSLTWDYAIYAQAAALIAHGDLYPWSSVRGAAFMQNHGELLLWPLALLVRLSGTTRCLLLVQAAAVGAAAATALHWVREVVRAAGLGPARARHVVGLFAGLLATNPWLYWATSFDVHMEVIVLPAVVLAGLALWQGRVGKAFLWAGVTVLAGDVAASYLVGLALSALFMGPAAKRAALPLAVLGGGAVLAFERLVPGGIVGTNLAGLYPQFLQGTVHPTVLTLLGAVATHLQTAADTLRTNLPNLFATVAPEGLLGLPMWPMMGVVWLVLVENGLVPSGTWTAPSLFQAVPVIPFATVATGLAVTGLCRRWDGTAVGRFSATLMLGLLGLNGAAWAARGLTTIPEAWARLSTAEVRVLNSLVRSIPAGAEVYASNQFVGRFAIRRWAYAAGRVAGDRLPLHGRPVYFILSPTGPMAVGSVAWNWTVAARVAALPGARPLVRRDGVCAYVWMPPPGQTVLDLPARAAADPPRACPP